MVEGWLGLPSVAGLALAFAFLRKELALQLLLVLAAATAVAGVSSLGDLMTPEQLFVYAIVTSVSIPCVATLAALAGELGWRTAIAMSAATLALAVGIGGDPRPASRGGLTDRRGDPARAWLGRIAAPIVGRGRRRSSGVGGPGGIGVARWRSSATLKAAVAVDQVAETSIRVARISRTSPEPAMRIAKVGNATGRIASTAAEPSCPDGDPRGGTGHEQALGADQVDAAGEAEEPFVRGEHGGGRARRDDDGDAEKDEGRVGIAGEREEPEEDASAPQHERDAQGPRGGPAAEQAADDRGRDEGGPGGDGREEDGVARRLAEDADRVDGEVGPEAGPGRREGDDPDEAARLGRERRTLATRRDPHPARAAKADDSGELADPGQPGRQEDDGVDREPHGVEARLHAEGHRQQESRAQPLGDPHDARGDEAALRLREDGAVPGQQVGAADGARRAAEAHDDGDGTDRGRRWQDAPHVEQDDAGEDEPAGLAEGEDRHRDAAQVAVRAPEEGRNQELGGREREGQDPDDRRHRGRRPEGQQERDGQAVAGKGDDGGRSDADPLVGPEAPVAEGAPLVDGQPRPGGRRGRGGEESRGTRRWYAAVAARGQSRVIVTPEPSSSTTSMIGPRRPVRIASRTRSA